MRSKWYEENAINMVFCYCLQGIVNAGPHGWGRTAGVRSRYCLLLSLLSSLNVSYLTTMIVEKPRNYNLKRSCYTGSV